MSYDHIKIEKKWQDQWEKSNLYRAEDFSRQPKFYCLDMFPYPSGEGLHVGHPEGYTATDIYSRYLRAKGYNVLHPMGWDAFGLPAENYAIKKKLHPGIVTFQNIDHFRKQIKSLGFSYDWDREVNTTDPGYYRWTQWIFLQLFKKGLAYEDTVPINWCPSCKTGLANEEVVNDECDRCHTKVEHKNMKQWLLKITEYADRLLKDVDLLDWPERIKEMQRNWIGKSEGFEIKFEIVNKSKGKSKKAKVYLNVFTTRVDTLYGATFLAISPEHPLVPKIVTAAQKKQVEAYQAMAQAKSDLERTELEKDKTGVFTGAYAVNPVNGQKIPIWMADYVMMNYAEGAIMCVPAHDDRDWAFAKKYGLPIIDVVQPVYGQPHEGEEIRLTVSVIIQRKSDRRYLCVRWKKFGWIAPPIGEIKPGETPEQAAEREAMEETGFEAKAVQKLGGLIESHFYDEKKKIWRGRWDQPVWLELDDEIQDVATPEEADRAEVVWLTREEVAQKITHPYNLIGFDRHWNKNESFVGDGKAINSDLINGLMTPAAKKKLGESLMIRKIGQPKINYKLHDWVFSRQRYWGEPIPIIHCPHCGVVPVPEKDLPVLLPEVEKYEPTGTGESPLAKIDTWVNTKCPECGTSAKRETNTMPQWAGSCWYYLRYLDPQNSQAVFDKKKMRYWSPVDLYVGGAEHAVLHLLYARFWHKVLYDDGWVDHPEPFIKLLNQGMILGEDGAKMSKSRGNVINPDKVVAEHGADTFRLYEMFMGPFADPKPWDTKGIIGVRRFLERIWNMLEKQLKTNGNKTDVSWNLLLALNRTIKKVTEDIENFRFNTAVSAMMVLLNDLEKYHIEKIKLDQAKPIWEKFIQILAPFAPHITEELWQKLGHQESVFAVSWPRYDEQMVKSAKVQLVVQINGKVREKLEVEADIKKETALKLAYASAKVKKWVSGKTVLKKIYVPGRLINFVIK